ncbi:MAG: efflux RND transporter permease subunit [Candidatus Absconditabacterales bacterium]|nr:efflux RND transporter permease subunit [Candidatus Absconditabacterales bacterium]
MNIFKTVIHRPILILMIFLALLGAGIFGILNLKIDLLPTVNLPIISVMVINPGMSSTDMEELITKKLESAFSDLGALKQINSWSMDSVSQVLVEFEYGQKDIDIAAIEIQRRINEIRSNLPATIEEPNIRKMDPASRPIMTLALYSEEEYNLRELRSYVENYLKTKIEKVDNVAKVIVNGGFLRQVNINIDGNRLASYKIDINQVITALRTHNMNLPAGSVKSSLIPTSTVVKAYGQFDSIQSIRDIVISSKNNMPIYLRDFAKVQDSYKEPSGYASINGKAAITMDVKKQTGTNTVEIAQNVRNVVELLKADLPEGFKIVIARDDSEFIELSIKGIIDTAWQGFILGFFVILFLIGTFKPAFVIFLSVPISIISAFFIMWAGKMSINMVSLYALTISIGVNFDNSIIVLENIIRHMASGKDRLEAASVGVAELAAPLFAATLTNVVVFIPLTMLEGYIGELMRTMAFTAIFAQTVALPVALFFTSTITPRIVKEIPKEVTTVPVFGKIVKVVLDNVEKLKEKYKKTLIWSIENRKKVLVLTLIIFIGSLFLLPFIGIEFMPRTDQNGYFVDIEMPVGTTLDETKRITEKIEKIILSRNEIEFLATTIGGDEQTSPSENTVSMNLKLINRKNRIMTALDTGNAKTDLITYLRKEILEKVPGIRHIQFVQPAPWWGSAGAPVEIKLSGNDWILLNELADVYVNKLSKVEGLFDVQKNVRDSKKEYKLIFDEAKMSQLGIAYGEIAMNLRTLINGGDTWNLRTEYRNNSLFRDRDIYIITRLQKEGRQDIEDIMSTKVITASGKTVDLKTILSIEKSESINFISKENKQRTITISAQTSDEPLSSLIFVKTMPVINSIKLPSGVDMKISGEVTRMNDQLSGMTIGFIIAAIFVYMVLAGQFESFLHPLIMMFSIPLQMIGVFLALFLTGNTLNTTSGNGIIALVGVVVNASIVLIDYINLLRKRGLTIKEALIEAGTTRFRPILMTVATTLFAMIPMALSQADGSDIYKPLAIAFIGGLISSTIMTLIVVPVLYAFLDEKFGKKEIVKD